MTLSQIIKLLENEILVKKNEKIKILEESGMKVNILMEMMPVVGLIKEERKEVCHVSIDLMNKDKYYEIAEKELKLDDAYIFKGILNFI